MSPPMSPSSCATAAERQKSIRVDRSRKLKGWRAVCGGAVMKPTLRSPSSPGHSNVDRSYVGQIARLTLLAPDIVEAILRGAEPSGLSLEWLTKQLPMECRASARRSVSRLDSPSATSARDSAARPSGSWQDQGRHKVVDIEVVPAGVPEFSPERPEVEMGHVLPVRL